MFLTLYLDVHELNVVDAVAFNHYWALPVKDNKEVFLKAISARHMTITHVIIRRPIDSGSVEYHCVELTGKSYVMVDNTPGEHTLPQLDAIIHTLALKHPLDTPVLPTPWVIEFATLPEVDDSLSIIETVTCAKTFPMTSQRDLKEHERYFHEFARALAAEYFNGA